MKVYVITRGAYSDYHICGVSLDKNLADKIAEGCSDKYEDADVEVYDTEEFSPLLKGGSVFFVGLVYGTNEIEVCEKDWDYKFIIVPLSASPESGNMLGRINKVVPMIRNQGCFTYVVAEDEEHARKIGSDILFQYKYEKDTYGETIYDKQ